MRHASTPHPPPHRPPPPHTSPATDLHVEHLNVGAWADALAHLEPCLERRVVVDLAGGTQQHRLEDDLTARAKRCGEGEVSKRGVVVDLAGGTQQHRLEDDLCSTARAIRCGEGEVSERGIVVDLAHSSTSSRTTFAAPDTREGEGAVENGGLGTC
eukprot:364667-Chlamydomonas_euryale.AAC.4